MSLCFTILYFVVNQNSVTVVGVLFTLKCFACRVFGYNDHYKLCCLSCRVATCSASETVTAATRKMKEHRMNSVIITSLSNKPTGILTYEHGAFIYAFLSCLNDSFHKHVHNRYFDCRHRYVRPCLQSCFLVDLMATAQRTS